MTETLAHRYSSENTQRKPSNEYQHDRVFKRVSVLVLRRKVASALEGLILSLFLINIFSSSIDGTH